MTLKFLHELGIENETEWPELKINFSAPNGLEIIVPCLLATEKIARLLYSIHNKLNYLFDYLNYQVVVQETGTIDKNSIKEYFSFICATPFLWKNKGDLVFLSERKNALENFIFRRNVVYLYFPNQPTLNEWKPKLITLKKILAKLGLKSIQFASQQKKKRRKN